MRELLAPMLHGAAAVGLTALAIQQAGLMGALAGVAAGWWLVLFVLEVTDG